MKQKKVSFEVAKHLEEVGYPQSQFAPQYKENGELENGFTDLGEGCVYAPTYLDVWLWLFNEKNIVIEPKCRINDNGNYYWENGWIDCTYYDQEEAIVAAIEYIVKDNLIK